MWCRRNADAVPASILNFQDSVVDVEKGYVLQVNDVELLYLPSFPKISHLRRGMFSRFDILYILELPNCRHQKTGNYVDTEVRKKPVICNTDRVTLQCDAVVEYYRYLPVQGKLLRWVKKERRCIFKIRWVEKRYAMEVSLYEERQSWIVEVIKAEKNQIVLFLGIN